jgi:hypothetical protein
MSTKKTAPRQSGLLPQVVAGMSALRDIQWMARRNAQPDSMQIRFDGAALSPMTDRESVAYRFNTATFLLERLLTRHKFTQCKTDPTANREYIETEQMGWMPVEVPSIWADGTSLNGFTPDAEVLAGIGEDEVAQLQWAVDVMHPLAHRYAWGRATYASSLLNDATRALRHAGFSLAATEAAGRSAWVVDGMGDDYDGLTVSERAERDAARA